MKYDGVGSIMRYFILCFFSPILVGCGSFVPSASYVQDDQLYEIDVKASIDCSVIDAVHEAYKQSAFLSNLRGQRVDFFENWGLQYSYTLKVIEDTSINPSLDLLTPTTAVSLLTPGDVVFTLGTGVKFTAKATKTVTNGDFDPMDVWNSQNKCKDEDPRNKISLARDDLGITSWLTSRLAFVDSGSITSLTAKEAFTYKLEFEIGKRANADPSWSFISRNLSEVSGLFSTGRKKTHTLQLTLGPTDPARVTLARQAAEQHFAGLIGSAINDR